MSVYKSVTGLLLTMAVGLAMAASAQADFTIDTFDGRVSKSDRVTPETQAAAHPYEGGARITFDSDPFEAPRTVVVDLPPGLVGNPNAVPKCTKKQFVISPTGCPPETQVGVTTTDGASGLTAYGVYALEPDDNGVAAQFGFNVLNIHTVMDATVRPSDYGLRLTVPSIVQISPIRLASLVFWGVPADPSHDSARMHGTGDCLGDVFEPAFTTCGGGSAGAATTPVAFLTNPADCSAGPLTTELRADSWQDPGDWKTASFVSHSAGADPVPLGVDGCDRLAFDPSFSATPTTTTGDSPTGLTVDLGFRTQGLLDPGSRAEPPLKKAVVTLPEGMTVNPASAGGLQACGDDHIGFGTDQAVDCPLAAKIGSVEATSPVLDETVTGSVYLRPQGSADPESGDMFRIVLVLKNDARGLLFKLPGSIRVDKATGRIVTTFDNNPQLPVENLRLTLKSGPRAPLATPTTCGTKTISAELTSWAGQTVTRGDSFTVPCTGLGGFSPSLTAGTTNPIGGAFTPFALTATKPDGNAALDGLKLALPTGLLARLKGNLNTQVGTVKAFAGPGSNPYVLPGKVFLEGAYGDAPFSLRVAVPAKAGPFDLGTVEVRQKIYVDPVTTQVTVVSDPIPTVVKGVPVRLQRLDVNVDKPGFIINPTSCAAKEIAGTLSSVAGQTAQLTNRFQVGDCASLGYTPQLAMTMSGKGQTKDGSHPALTARLTPPVGDANSKKVTVTLPLSLALDPGNANGLCEPVDAARNACPAASIVGSAQAQSILPDTLKGPVYFVRGERTENGRIRKTTPKLFIPLTANGVTVYVWGDSNADSDRLVTTFDNLPDAPFSTFDLTINGGKHGILVVSGANTCAATNVADAKYAGQNGKSYTSKVTMGTPCALGVVKSSHTSTALKLTVGGLGAGKVSGSGNGVAKASKTLASSTTATLSLPLTKATRRALARGRDVKVKVKVAFTATGQKKAKTATKTVVLHGTKKR